MKLRKKIIREGDFERFFEHILEYDEKGNLIFESKSSPQSGTWEKEYSYDSNNRIILITELNGNSSTLDQYKLEHVYEYNGESYRINTVLKKTRSYHDVNTYEYLVLGEEIWHNVEEMTRVQEFTYSNGNLVKEKSIFLNSNETYTINYKYENKNLIQKTKVEKDINNTIKYVYDNNNLIEIHFFLNNQIIKKEKYKENILIEIQEYSNNIITSKKEFLYHNNLLVEETSCTFQNEIEHNTRKETIRYDSKNRIIEKNYYRLFNSKMHLFNITEITYDDHYNNVVTRSKGIMWDDFNYIFETLNEKNVETDPNTLPSNFEEFMDGESDYPLYFDDCQIEKFAFDNETNYLIELLSYSNLNKDKVYQHLYYHYEFEYDMRNKQKLLELELCFDLEDKNSIDLLSRKKYYYF